MSSQEQWDAVDALIGSTLLGEDDEVLANCLAASGKAGLPDIAVSPAQGKFLAFLAMVSGARRILEIGTLGGYSAIWLARGAGPGGRVVTLEQDLDFARIARVNLSHAGLDRCVEVIVGPARKTLLSVAGSFDMAFIDADKENNIHYLEHLSRIVVPGGLIIVDNVVRSGRILDANASDDATRTTRLMYDYVANETRLDATALQTVGSKGWDGMLIARVCG